MRQIIPSALSLGAWGPLLVRILLARLARDRVAHNAHRTPAAAGPAAAGGCGGCGRRSAAIPFIHQCIHLFVLNLSPHSLALQRRRRHLRRSHAAVTSDSLLYILRISRFRGGAAGSSSSTRSSSFHIRAKGTRPNRRRHCEAALSALVL